MGYACAGVLHPRIDPGLPELLQQRPRILCHGVCWGWGTTSQDRPGTARVIMTSTRTVSVTTMPKYSSRSVRVTMPSLQLVLLL